MFKAILVDDEPLILDTLRDFTNWDKFHITISSTFQNGQDALDYIRNNVCDIIITDVRMPGTDGITMSTRAREAGCKAQIVFLSGYDDFEYLKNALRVNACDYLLKPLDFDEFDNTLSTLVSRLEKGKAGDDLFYDDFKPCAYGAGGNFSIGDPSNFSKELYQAISKDNKLVLKELCHGYFCCQHGVSASADAIIADLSRILADLVSRYIPYADQHIPLLSKLYSIKRATEMEAYILECLYAMNDTFNKPILDVKIKLVNQMIQYIQENYHSIHSVEDVSEKLFISESYVRQLIKRYTGKTFTGYLTEVRMNKAVELLKDRDLKIKYIAEKIGYKTESYFSSLFEENKGLTPYEYRKRNFKS